MLCKALDFVKHLWQKLGRVCDEDKRGRVSARFDLRRCFGAGYTLEYNVFLHFPVRNPTKVSGSNTKRQKGRGQAPSMNYVREKSERKRGGVTFCYHRGTLEYE